MGHHRITLIPGDGIGPEAAGFGFDYARPHGRRTVTAGHMAIILSAAMILDHLSQRRGAAALRWAVADVVAAGSVRTPDLGGTSSTANVADAIAEAASTRVGTS